MSAVLFKRPKLFVELKYKTQIIHTNFCPLHFNSLDSIIKSVFSHFTFTHNLYSLYQSVYNKLYFLKTNLLLCFKLFTVNTLYFYINFISISTEVFIDFDRVVIKVIVYLCVCRISFMGKEISYWYLLLSLFK